MTECWIVTIAIPSGNQRWTDSIWLEKPSAELRCEIVKSSILCSGEAVKNPGGWWAWVSKGRIEGEEMKKDRVLVDAITAHICHRVYSRLAQIGRAKMDAAIRDYKGPGLFGPDYVAGLQMFRICGAAEVNALPWMDHHDSNPLNEEAKDYTEPAPPETCYHCGREITLESGRETREYAPDPSTGYRDVEILCGECAAKPDMPVTV